MTYGRHPDCVTHDDTDIESILGAHARALSEAGEGAELLAYLYEASYQLRSAINQMPDGMSRRYPHLLALADQADHLRDHVDRKLRDYRRAA